MNWVEIFNRLWRIIDQAGATNFSGPRFLDAVREVNFNVPPYGVFMAHGIELWVAVHGRN